MRRSPLSYAILAALALAAAGCGGSAGSEPDLAFVSTRDGDYAIYGMRADGSDQRRLSKSDGVSGSSPRKLFFQVDPAWSPDGRSIAFASKRRGTFDIFVMAVDGTGTRRLTATQDDDAHPSWSPDGTRIVFQRGAGPLYVVSARGGRAQRLGDDVAEETHPAWSPDGRWIVYVRREPGSSSRDLWLVHPNGLGPRRLTHLQSRVYEPAWSPDSRQVAFVNSSEETNFDLFVVRFVGEAVRRLTRSASDEFAPSWSPDGSEIAFGRNGSIVVSDLNGHEETLTDSIQNDSSAVWRPMQPSSSG